MKISMSEEACRISERKGPFAVLEYQKDSSVNPANADTEYFMAQMGVRKKQLMFTLSGNSVTLQAGAMQDEWSTDYGVGCKYFSQDAVIKLAPAAGIDIPAELSLAEKLKFVQKLMEADDPRAIAIFETIGAYFAYATVQYSQFYNIDYMMLMGRVMSGKGGDTILKVCNDILAEEYPELYKKCAVMLPDEKMRRVGQSVAAASLPKIK